MNKIIKEPQGKTNPYASLVANRLTITGFALTILIFSITFSFTFLANEITNQKSTFEIYALDIVTTTVLGILCGIIAVIFFLTSEHIVHDNQFFTVPPVVKFTWGQLFLYLTLAESLSASLAPLTLRISLISSSLGYAFGIAGSLVWVWLLYIGPIFFLRSVFDQLSLHQRRGIALIYPILVLVIFGVLALAYTKLEYDSFNIEGFIKMYLFQIVQPITWPMVFTR